MHLEAVPDAQETNVSNEEDDGDAFAFFLQTCLKESDGSDTEDFGSDHSEDCLSEESWEPVDKKETEVRPGGFVAGTYASQWVLLFLRNEWHTLP